MRSRYWLVILAIVAFLATLALFLPASLVGGRLPSNVSTGTLSGTIWNGSAEQVTLDGRPLGNVHWRMHPLRLLSGSVSADAELLRDGAEARGQVALVSGQKLDIANLSVRWPLAELPISAVPRGWTGELEVNAPTLRLDKGALVDLQGTIDLRNLQQKEVAVGGYRVTFDESARQDGALVGRLEDTGGPLQVSGTVRLGTDRSYAIDGLVAARPDAPARMAEDLRYLGAPDAQGRRPFSVGGTY